MLDRSASCGDVHAAACLGASNYITFPTIWKNLLGGNYFPVFCWLPFGGHFCSALCSLVAPVLHWLSFQRQRVLRCITGYHFGDRDVSHAAWRSPLAPDYTFLQRVWRFFTAALRDVRW